MSFANPDEPVEVPPEMMISAWPYGPANIPVQEDVRKLMASKNDKGMKIFGFTPLDTVPQWYGMEEARVLVPHPTKDISAAAGLAATAGCSVGSQGGEGIRISGRRGGFSSAQNSRNSVPRHPTPPSRSLTKYHAPLPCITSPTF